LQAAAEAPVTAEGQTSAEVSPEDRGHPEGAGKRPFPSPRRLSRDSSRLSFRFGCFGGLAFHGGHEMCWVRVQKDNNLVVEIGCRSQSPREDVQLEVRLEHHDRVRQVFPVYQDGTRVEYYSTTHNTWVSGICSIQVLRARSEDDAPGIRCRGGRTRDTTSK